MPSRIVADHFNQEELELMSKYLATYQKGEVGWDVFRLKIPTELLKKLEAVLVECRSNGFINPIVSIGERGDYRLLWSQILSDNPGDKCSSCTRKPCIEREDAKGQFIPCWKATA